MKMDDRMVIAWVLIALMVVAAGILAIRYFAKRRAFKIRQSGRGKSIADDRLD